MIFSFLYFVFIVTTLVQLLFWIFIFSKLAFYNVEKERKNSAPLAPVSLIICAKNEFHNLKKNLAFFLNQNYNNYEVVLMDDGSDDGTKQWIESQLVEYPHLKYHVVQGKPKESIGKKYALAQGIGYTKHEILQLTDADCSVTSENWLCKMNAQLIDNKDIVLGYAPYIRRNGWLNKFIRFETVWTAMQYFSFHLAGMPYMGVGRNLMYRKVLFQKANGFEKHQHLASGDDDLFVNETATKNNTTMTLDPETFVYSEAKVTLADYLRQKMRHLSVGTAYRMSHQLLLGVLTLSLILNYITGMILLLNNFSTVFAIIKIYLVTITIKWLFYAPILKKLHERSLIWWIPILEIMLCIYFVVLTPLIIIKGKPNTWK